LLQPILNGSDGAVTEQYALTGANASSPPTLCDMLGIDDRYDAAAEGFIRQTISAHKPFFFYFCSHHTHAPQFAPASFLGYSKRGLHGDSLGLVDRSAGRFMNLSKELGIDDNTLMIFSADKCGGCLQ
jgi:arylsulfatase A-like enzyme